MQNKQYKHNWYMKNKKRLSKIAKTYRRNHKEEIKQHNKQYYIDNKEWINKQNKEYSDAHPDVRRRSHKRFNKNSEKTMHNLKINGCAICGYDKCDKALDFHHTNPDNKKFKVTRQYAHRKDVIDEVNKCILLCSNCHREIHA